MSRSSNRTRRYDPTRLFLSNNTDRIISTYYNQDSINNIPIGHTHIHTFGSTQLIRDNREGQCIEGTHLSLYFDRRNTNKKFVILSIGIQREVINGLTGYNDHIAVLRRVY